MKVEFLGVPNQLLQKNGAVSKEVATAMARGIREKTGADLALSITGIAGPDGGTEEKPVGTVYIGLAAGDKVQVGHRIFDGNREQIQEITAVTALDMLRRHLLNLL